MFTLDNTKDFTGNLATNMLYIGSLLGWSQFAPCTISDFRVYSGELTSDEICYVSKHPTEAGSYTPSSLLTGLIDYWPMDETNGTARADLVGSNNLTPIGTVAATSSGRLGPCLLFPISNTNYLSVADNASFDFTDKTFTVSCWITASAVTSSVNAVVKRDDSHLDFQVIYLAASQRFAFYYSDSLKNVAATTFGVPTANIMCNVVAWMNTTNDTINIQINAGATNTTALASTRQAHTSAPLVVGSNNLTPRSYSYGAVDEVMIWNRVLTLAERQAIYNGGLGRSIP